MSEITHIHIGKCAGSSIRKAFGLKFFHLERPKVTPDPYQKFILFVRNPISRFVSAFNQSKTVVSTLTDDLALSHVNVRQHFVVKAVRRKIKSGIAYTEEYDGLINSFTDANHLAESISSSSLALKLMNHPKEHIYKGIGWYLSNGLFIKKHFSKIMFVGTVENMEYDFEKLSKLLLRPSRKPPIIRKNHHCSKFLSPLAVKNLRMFYKDTDYKAIRTLVDFKFLNPDIENQYLNSP